ncbi:hypothetical protein BJ912DRAFT_1061550 [Pholiota molesta]|nr:hypothetical protein BJ912DRAFT_1061550 [Pholiota molesta]
MSVNTRHLHPHTHFHGLVQIDLVSVHDTATNASSLESETQTASMVPQISIPVMSIETLPGRWLPATNTRQPEQNSGVHVVSWSAAGGARWTAREEESSVCIALELRISPSSLRSLARLRSISPPIRLNTAMHCRRSPISTSTSHVAEVLELLIINKASDEVGVYSQRCEPAAQTKSVTTADSTARSQYRGQQSLQVLQAQVSRRPTASESRKP